MIEHFSSVMVKALGRLHLGFLDMHGGLLNRRFGGLGLGITGVETKLIARHADNVSVIGSSSSRAVEFVKKTISNFNIKGGVEIEIESSIPEHSGLGSGTQLSLAIATAVTRLHGLCITADKLAVILNRGMRSGIGIGAFAQGGFIVDAGRGENTHVPPVISRLPFPEDWRIILIFDKDISGVNGVLEKKAFDELSPMSENQVGMLCRLTVMQALPAIREQNCEQFGAAITSIQNIIGDYFAQVQGERYMSPLMSDILAELFSNGATGYGQSSWGPTGFAFFVNEKKARQAVENLSCTFNKEDRLSFLICQGCNHEAEILVKN